MTAPRRRTRRDRNRRSAGALTVARWGVLVVALVAIVALTAVLPLIDTRPQTWDGFVFLLMPLLWAGAGVLVMVKRPWHPVGWCLIWVALGLTTTHEWSLIPEIGAQWRPWLAWAAETSGGYLTYAGMVALLIVFPDGTRSRSRRERRLGRLVMTAMFTLLALAVVSDPVGNAATGSSFPNPLGVALMPRTVIELGYLLVFATIAGAVYWMWRRRQQAADEEQRRYTLVLYSFAALITALVVGISLGEITELAWLPAAALWVGVPVAFAVAVVRHGLYGVDRLVSRTVTYGSVGLVVSTVFAVPALLIPTVFGVSSDLAVASATLAAAAVFNPLRRRVRKAADRRFHRTRFDADREAASFSSRIRTVAGLDQVVPELQRVVRRTVQPSSTSVWIRPTPTPSEARTRPSGHSSLSP